MKKIFLTAALAVVAMFGAFAATPEKYFSYDICPSFILTKLGIKGDYVYIKNVDVDKMDDDNITTLEYPKEIEGLPVVAIKLAASEAWADHPITKISVPDSVQWIDIYGFVGEKVTLIEYAGTKPLYFGMNGGASAPKHEADKALFIGALAQKGRKIYCTGVEVRGIGKSFVFTKDYIYDKASDTEIGESNHPFFDGDDIEELSFEEGITEIGNCGNNKDWGTVNGKLTKVVLPSTAKIIKPFAFTKCKNLKEVIFPEGTKYTYEMINIDWTKTNEAFKGCSSLGLKAKSAIKASSYTGEF